MSKKKDRFDVSEIVRSIPAAAAAAAALSTEERAGLVNALKNLAGEHADVLESLTPKIRKRVEALRELQSQLDELEENFLEERKALEAKYQKLYEPLYTKRFGIVNGAVEASGVDQGGADPSEAKGVPNFWLTAMKTHEVLAEQIMERDEGALKYLKDIKWCRINEPKGFKLEFLFDTNPYFENTVLTKNYHMIDEDEPILEKATGMEIQWYPGKTLTQKLLRKKPKKGSKNAKAVITKAENCESFFNFFNPPQIVVEQDEDLDKDTAEELQTQMEQDYEIGSTIRDKIIPHAVSWFTGEAAKVDEFEAMGDGDEDEDEEEEEEDEEGDGEDEEESKSRKKTPSTHNPKQFEEWTATNWRKPSR